MYPDLQNQGQHLLYTWTYAYEGYLDSEISLTEEPLKSKYGEVRIEDIKQATHVTLDVMIMAEIHIHPL